MPTKIDLSIDDAGQAIAIIKTAVAINTLTASAGARYLTKALACQLAPHFGHEIEYLLTISPQDGHDFNSLFINSLVN